MPAAAGPPLLLGALAAVAWAHKVGVQRCAARPQPQRCPRGLGRSAAGPSPGACRVAPPPVPRASGAPANRRVRPLSVAYARGRGGWTLAGDDGAGLADELAYLTAVAAAAAAAVAATAQGVPRAPALWLCGFIVRSPPSGGSCAAVGACSCSGGKRGGRGRARGVRRGAHWARGGLACCGQLCSPRLRRCTPGLDLSAAGASLGSRRCDPPTARTPGGGPPNLWSGQK
jgi:hypothetical protein